MRPVLLKTLAVATLLGSLALALEPGTRDLLDQSRALADQAEAENQVRSPDAPLWHKALNAAEQAGRLEPDAPEVWLTQAELYSRVGWWIKAHQSWERYAEVGGDGYQNERASVARQLGYAAYQRRDLAQAQEFYQAALRAIPDDPETLFWLGRIAKEMGDLKGAAQYWQKAAELDPSERNQYFAERSRLEAAYGTPAVEAFYRGNAALAAGNRSEAFQAFSDAGAAAHHWGEPQRKMAEVGLQIGEFAAALKAANQAIALEGATPANRELAARASELADAWQQGQVYLEEGEAAAAQKNFAKVVAAAPDFVPAWRQLGQAAMSAGDFAVATEAYAQVLEFEPNDNQAAYFYRLAQGAASSPAQGGSEPLESPSEEPAASPEEPQAEPPAESPDGEPEVIPESPAEEIEPEMPPESTPPPSYQAPIFETPPMDSPEY